MRKYIIVQSQEDMNRLFNQPAGLRAGLTLAELYPIQTNSQRITGFFFIWDEVENHLGTARQTLTDSLSAPQDFQVIETKEPEKYGLIIPTIEEPNMV